MTLAAQHPAPSHFEQDFKHQWDLLARLKQNSERAGIGSLIAKQQRKVERMIGQLILEYGFTNQRIHDLISRDPFTGIGGLFTMTIREYLADYRGFPAWFQSGDDFHMVSQAPEHNPRLDQDSRGHTCHVEYWRALDGQFCVTEASAVALVDLGGVLRR